MRIEISIPRQELVLLDDADRIGEGSRGICYAKRSLEIWDRLGVGERLRDHGVIARRGDREGWHRGRRQPTMRAAP